MSNHDELMANFFAQPDALAVGKSAEELAAEGVGAALVAHRVMPGNRPSNVLLLPRLTAGAYEVGQLLALLPSGLTLLAATVFLPLSALAVVLFFVNLKKIMHGPTGPVPPVSSPPPSQA